MKKKAIIVAAFLLITTIFTSCDNSTKQDVAKEETATAEHKHKEHSTDESACKMPLTAEDSTKFFNASLEVKGDVEFPLMLTIDSLKKMNVLALDSFKVVCQTGATTTGNVNFRGVLLKEILEKANIVQHSHKDRNFYIVARSTDGYMATFSWAEIFNNPTGENTYVIFEENDAPIRKGAFVLNTTNDIKTGPRHVYWLKSIEVKRVEL